MKFSTRLILIFLGFTILLLFFVGLIAYVNANQTIIQNTEHHLMATSLYKQEELLRWFNDSQQKMLLLAQRPLVIELAEEIQEPEISSTSIASIRENLVRNHFLPHLLDDNFTDISLLNPSSGIILVSTDETDEGRFLGNEPFFNEGKKGIFISELHYVSIERDVIMHISVPIVNLEDELVAVLAGHVNLDVMSNIMQVGENIIQGEESYLVNKDYYFVSQPLFGDKKVLEDKALTQGIRDCLDGNTGVDEYDDYDGVPVFGAYRWIPSLNLCLVSELYEASARGPIFQLRNQMFVVGLITAILMTGAGVRVSEQMIRPIKQLINATDQIRSGNYRYTIDDRGVHELSTLAKNFNQMAQTLDETQQQRKLLLEENLAWTQELEKRVEEQTQIINAAETRFQSAIESAPFPIMIHAETGDVILVNKAWMEISGYDKEDISTVSDWTKKAYGNKQSEIAQEIDRLYSSETPVDEGEFTVRTANGENRIWTYSSAPLGEDNIGRRCVISIAVDVTERKQSEIITQRERLFSDALVNSIPGIFFLLNENGNLIRWNQNLEGMATNLGEHLNDRHFSELFASDDRSKIGDFIVKGFNQDRHQTEANLVSTNNQNNLFLLTGKSVQLREESFLIGVGLDITIRKEMEKRIRESEERYRTLAESAPELIYLIDLEANLTYANTMAQRLFGVKPDDFIGKGSFELFPEKVAKSQMKNFTTVIKTRETFSHESKLTAGGKEIWLDTILTPIFNSQGEVIEVLGISRDVTERKRQQNELNRALADLRQSNQDLEQFAYVASHDLQEPLRMVSSYVHLIESRYKDQLDEDANDFIHYAVDGAKRMQVLLNELLKYSRVGTRGDPLEVVSSQEVFETALKNLELIIKEQDASIICEPLPDVLADKSQLIRVFQNLINNAIKFNDKEVPEIEIGARKVYEEPHQPMWEFSIKDNGIGLDPEFAERIFVIFQRLHSKEEYPGTGIGLAICKKIIERHGGKIWVEKNRGEGATFLFTLKVANRD